MQTTAELALAAHFYADGLVYREADQVHRLFYGGAHLQQDARALGGVSSAAGVGRRVTVRRVSTASYKFTAGFCAGSERLQIHSQNTLSRVRKILFFGYYFSGFL